MEIKEITDRSTWDNFLQSSPYNYFLQTWQWGEFYKEGLKRKVWRLGFFDDYKLAGVGLFLEEFTKLGRYVYCPRGPVIAWDNAQLRGHVISAMIKFFKDKGIVFLRIDPAVLASDKNVENELHRLGFVDAIKSVQVERAWMLDLKGKTEDELLAGMRKNSRYYLRKAINQGVNVRITDSKQDMQLFIDMLHNMAKRKGFVALPKEYLQKEFDYVVPSDLMKVLVAEYKGKPIASAMIAFYGKEGSYLHAASTEENANLQAPYLVQWEAIKFAMKMGLEKYNFWGIVEDKKYKPGLPGFGYSNFKKGFGGRLETYIRTKDYAYNWLKYNAIRAIEAYRAKKFKSI